MVVSRQHSLEEAARFSGLNKAQFSKLLKHHPNVALDTLQTLSKKQAKHVSKALHYLAQNGLPWQIAILIDSTIQHRASGSCPRTVERFLSLAYLGHRKQAIAKLCDASGG